MERLVVGKTSLSHFRHFSGRQMSKAPIMLHHLGKDYVNLSRLLIFSRSIYSQTGCTYSQARRMRREYNAVMRLIYINGLLSAPKICSSQICMYSTDTDRKEDKQEKEDGNKESTNEKDNGGGKNKMEFDQLEMILGGSFMLLVCFGVANFVMMPSANEMLPRHISFEEFQANYLMNGLVKDVTVFRSRQSGEVPVVSLHPEHSPPIGVRPKPSFVIVDSLHAGDFEQKLVLFERSHNVPAHESIPVRKINSFTFLENRSSYNIMLFEPFFVAIIFALTFVMKRRYRLMMKPPKMDKMNKDVPLKDDKDLFDDFNAIKTNLKQRKNKDPDRDPHFFEDFLEGDKFQRGDRTLKQKVTFKDVAGLHEPKVEIMEFVEYIKNPGRFVKLGARTPHGALLLGPPGCGKTLLAKALATECGVPFYSTCGSDFTDMIVGVGARRVRQLFKKARRTAPCIIYIDEIDAVGAKRSEGSNINESSAQQDHERTLNQLLAEMDGMQTRDGVIVLASTNRSDILDKALLRPGRFDRHIMIPLPTMSEREEHFELYLKQLSLKHPPSTYSKRLAQLTPGMSGADIANICNEAAIHAARDQKKFVTGEDLDYAIERVIAGPAKKTGMLSPTERKRVAYHESGHALLGWLLQHTVALLKVTIVPRTSSALGFAQYIPKETSLYSREEFFDMMCMGLGGRAAESIIFNQISTGAQNDLEQATKVAYALIKTYGMSQSVGLISFPLEEQYGIKPYSKKLQNVLDLEARQLLAEAYKHAEDVLRENIDKLHKLAALLLEKETINSKDVENLIGPPPFGEKTFIDPNELFDEVDNTSVNLQGQEKSEPALKE